MKRLFLCLVSAALPAFGGHHVTSLAPIVLYAQFQQEPPPVVFAALQAEVNSVMASTDLLFTWRALSAARGNEVSVMLAVITFKGRCDIAGLTPHNSHTGPLGWTHINDGVILPFAEIDCQGIRGFIQKQLFARGLGKAAYSVRELLSPTFQFEARESLALKAGKAHAALEWAAFER